MPIISIPAGQSSNPSLIVLITGMNPEKTLDGALIRTYEYDPVTADAELLLSKDKYQAITGREQMRKADVLRYQIRQFFPPGELSPEGALADGYETTMRWTREKHAFFVAAHVDRPYLRPYVLQFYIAGLCPESVT